MGILTGPMRIDLEVQGVERSSAALRAVAGAGRDLAAAERALSTANRGLERSISHIASSMTSLRRATREMDAASGNLKRTIEGASRWDTVFGSAAKALDTAAASARELSQAEKEIAASNRQLASSLNAYQKIDAGPASASVKELARNLSVLGAQSRVLEEAPGTLKQMASAAKDLSGAEKDLAQSNRVLAASIRSLLSLPKTIRLPSVVAGGAQQASPKPVMVAAKPQALPRAPGALRAPRQPSDPWADLARARQAYGNAVISGDLNAVRAARWRLQRADRAVQRAENDLNPQPLPFGLRLARAVMSSRFGAGGMSPLVGRSLDVLFPGIHKAIFGGGATAAARSMGGLAGVGGMAGAAAAVPYVAAALAAFAVAKAGVEAFADAVRTAGERLQEFASARMLSGGTGGQISALMAHGLGAADVPGMAAALRERLATDAVAASMGHRLGIDYRAPGIFGPANQAQDLLQAMRGLRAMGQTPEQLQTARALGLEGLLPKVNVSERVWRQQERDAEVSASIATPDAQQAGTDFIATLRRVGEMFDLIKTALGKDFLPGVNRGIGAFADSLRNVAKSIGEHPRLWKTLGILAGGFFAGLGKMIEDLTKAGTRLVESGAWKAIAPGFLLIGKAMEFVVDAIVALADPKAALRRAGAYGEAEARAQAKADIKADMAREKRERELLGAIKDNTDAHHEQSRLMRQGMHGGGQRLRGGWHQGWNGEFLQQNWTNQSWQLGAFGLG